MGAIAGLLCLGGTALLNLGISIEYLLHILYLRIVLGLILGIIGDIKLINHELGNPILRGAIMGVMLSIPLLMVPVPTAMNYLIAGIVFGIVIDVIASKLASE